MPLRALRPCGHPGCPEISRTYYCAEHRRESRRKHDATRPNAARRGYDAKWRKLRAEVLRERPICDTPGCGARSKEVDHIVAMKHGGYRLSKSNLRALCKSCHSSKTGRVDRQSARSS